MEIISYFYFVKKFGQECKSGINFNVLLNKIKKFAINFNEFLHIIHIYFSLSVICLLRNSMHLCPKFHSMLVNLFIIFQKLTLFIYLFPNNSIFLKLFPPNTSKVQKFQIQKFQIHI